MRARVGEIVVDCQDPRLLVRFWAGLLGGEPVDREPGWSYVEPPEFVRLAFQQVPEGKQVKNRLHLDLEVDAVDPAVTEALRLGATRLGEPVTDDYGSFQVMADPEGNEFCFVWAD
ncbi:VOC family protein [Streptomyces sp. AV19]|uniref:VOC family protein n=1 Tax=Streptomyces sp. AV19 TaxID=2793068 RepID=UPI0018FECB96|nr:VOC family protein [Streptomyces sp. AV19]MBH1935860.1 VOC family protein [Streptomyces sp. AV19]MDG4534356.1 VOC family protein [Streptomyces sp. AV19]